MTMKAPKTKVKAIVKHKTKTDVKLRPAAAAMVELSLLLFLNMLAVEARTKASEEKCATVRGHHLQAVCKKILKKSRG
ncbi:hypothetical protein CRUP_021962 [Coryphaenoides rupestris]|nr:hypothetical protein CRUP_021962 [Coryphaenoides rupestris]